MVSSLNQVRHLYVANALVDKGTAISKPGDIQIGVVGDSLQKEVYFKIQGPDTPIKSDYIPVKNITSIKAIKASDMATPMKKVLVTLDKDVNNGLPIPGQDYILRINFRQFYGMSDQDQYFKDAAIHALKNMTALQFYTALKDSLDRCFSREVGATIKSNPYLAFTASAKGLEIEEKPQSWTLGTEAQERVYFEVVPTTVYDGVDDLIWGKVTQEESTTKIPNGKKMADLEYFLLGERGDQYRKIGWPNDIETKGLVDPTKAYDVLEIHYAFTDTGVNSYKTEKDLTLAVPTSKDHAALNSIVNALSAATRLAISALTAETSTGDDLEEGDE